MIFAFIELNNNTIVRVSNHKIIFFVTLGLPQQHIPMKTFITH